MRLKKIGSCIDDRQEMGIRDFPLGIFADSESVSVRLWSGVIKGLMDMIKTGVLDSLECIYH